MYLQADTVGHRQGHFLGKDDSRDSALPIYILQYIQLFIYTVYGNNK